MSTVRFKVFVWRIFLGILCCQISISPVGSQETETPTVRPTVAPVSISKELRHFEAGAPLSQRTFVQRPAALKGLVSWSIETKRPRGVLYTAAISPDSKQLATGGIDGIIRIWNLENGEFERVLVGHDSYIFALAWSPDGNTLASAGAWDYTAKLWDVRNGQMLRTFKHEGYVSKVMWSGDGRVLFVGGSESGAALMWDVTHASEIAKRGFGQPLLATAWAPDGHAFVVTSRQSLGQIFDTSSFGFRSALGDEAGEVTGAAWSPDSKLLAASNTKGTRIWDDEGKKFIQTIDKPAHTCAWSPDGKMLATSTSGGIVQLWNVADGKAIKNLPINATNIHWSSDGRVIVGQTSSLVSVFDLEANRIRFSINNGYALQTVWSRSGRSVLFGLGTKKVSVWDLAPNKPLRAFDGHAAAVNSAALTSSGKVLATASSDKTVKIWDVTTEKEMHTLQGHTAAVNVLAWASNGKSLASGSADKTIKIWDAPAGELTKTLEGHTDAVTVLTWGSKAIASGGLDQNAISWNPQSGQLIRTFPVYAPVKTLAWTFDGSFLAGGGTEHTLYIWNAATGMAVKRLDRAGSPPSVTGVAWSANPAVIASGRGNHTLQLWDLRTDKVIRDLKTLAPVLSVSWSFDGKYVVAGTQDRCVRSWDAATGQLRASAVAEEERATAISAEGHFRLAAEGESDLVGVAQTASGQETLPINDFVTKYRWKNSPSLVKLTSD